MSDKSKYSYLAGIIDGEGCFCIGAGRRQKWGVINYNPQILVGNTDHRLTAWLKENFGGVTFTQRPNNPRCKIPSIWRLSKKKDMELLILAIMPYLIIKKERAIVFLEFLRLPPIMNPERREELWKQLSILNKRGVDVETNTSSDPENGSKIESELTGDSKSGPVVTQETATPVMTA